MNRSAGGISRATFSMPTDLIETIEKLIRLSLRFTFIHTPNEKKVTLVSCTDPDKIKHHFPEFNIYLSAGKTKTVERVFFY